MSFKSSLHRMSRERLSSFPQTFWVKGMPHLSFFITHSLLLNPCFLASAHSTLQELCKFFAVNASLTLRLTKFSLGPLASGWKHFVPRAQIMATASLFHYFHFIFNWGQDLYSLNTFSTFLPLPFSSTCSPSPFLMIKTDLGTVFSFRIFSLTYCDSLWELWICMYMYTSIHPYIHICMVFVIFSLFDWNWFLKFFYWSCPSSQLSLLFY